MAATVTASISSLILTLDDPGRDDLSSVLVWASTVNGFTPSASNLVFSGKSLVITIANLTPLTTYYLRYAYVSEIEPANYEISAQLSGTPNKIDGSVIVDGSITASQISATALRGKMLAGNVFVDGGSVASASVAKPANVNTSTTVSLLDTVDFPTAGAAIVLPKGSYKGGVVRFRYAGKTATTLTGVTGLQYAITAGDIVVPQSFPSFAVDSYDGITLDPGGVGIPGAGAGGAVADNALATAAYIFRATGGTAIAICGNRAADVFTYTAGHTFSGGSYYSALTGVSGLATFTAAARSRTYIVDLPEARTVTAPGGAVSSLTLSASSSYLNANGGTLLLASGAVAGIFEVPYSAYSGTTVTVDGSVTLTAGTYYVIPVFSLSVYGADRSPVINFTNARNGFWLSSGLGVGNAFGTNLLDQVNIKSASGHGLKVYPTKKTSEDEAPSVFLGEPERVLHIDMQPAAFASLDKTVMATLGGFVLGAASFVAAANYVLSAYDGVSNAIQQYQHISTTLRFSPYDAADLDAITFNDTTNTYSFGADNGTANAIVAAAQFDVGGTDTSITRSAAGVIAVEGGVVPLENRANTFSQNQTFYRAAGTSAIFLQGDAGYIRTIAYRTGTSNRFQFTLESTAESGSNAGSNFEVYRFSDAGALLGTAISINRATGLSTFEALQAPTINVGNADTTIARVSAGVISVEGGTVPLENRVNTFSAVNNFSERVGIGSYSTVANLNINKTITGATTAYSVVSSGAVQSDVTGTASVFTTSTGTAAASFTLGNLIHFYANQGTIGAGSTVSTQYGFLSGSSLIGATTNYGFLAQNTAAVTTGKTAYGFYSAVNTATGGGTAFSFYSAGTAPNRFSGDVTVFGAGGLGYSTGSGGAVTQGTSRTTGVTLNKTNGAITLFSAAGVATYTTFTVTNSTVAATDTVIACQKSGTNTYEVFVTAVAAGSFNITFASVSGTATDSPVFNFAVIKAVTA